MTPRTDNENIFIPPCRIKEEKKKKNLKFKEREFLFEAGE